MKQAPNSNGFEIKRLLESKVLSRIVVVIASSWRSAMPIMWQAVIQGLLECQLTIMDYDWLFLRFQEFQNH
jgi:hypothetical protein